jgi:hypothetical protein
MATKEELSERLQLVIDPYREGDPAKHIATDMAAELAAILAEQDARIRALEERPTGALDAFAKSAPDGYLQSGPGVDVTAANEHNVAQMRRAGGDGVEGALRPKCPR